MIAAPARRLCGALVLFGLLTHLPGLGSPAQVVFDEVHWGKAVNAYCCTGERIFDVHPPHGKLVLTLGAVIAGYGGGQSFERIGLPFDQGSSIAFRWLPSLVGALIPALFFLLLVGLGASTPAAFLGGLLLVLDNALLLETRVMLFDGILVAAILGSLVCLLAAEGASTAGRGRAWRLAAGALAGLAVGTKFTGLVAPALAVIWLGRGLVLKMPAPKLRWTHLVEPAVAGVLVYLVGWVVHLSLLTQPGGADAFHPTTGSFVEDFQTVHSTMFSANYNMRTPHPDASGPLSWPWMKVAPFFWAGTDRSLHLVGNPVVWWGSAVLLIGVAVIAVLRPVTRLRLEPPTGPPIHVWWAGVGFVLSFAPFFGIERTLFLYHYFTPLIFALAIVVLWLDRAGWTLPGGIRAQRRSYFAVIVLAVIGFLLMAPLTYGFSLDTYDEAVVSVIRSWR